MIRKGIKFRRSRTLGYDMGDGVIRDAKGRIIESNYVVIYRYQGIEDWQADRVHPRKGFVLDEDATRRSRERGDRVTWYRKPVKMTGHSRTNMVYGENIKFAGHLFCKIYWVEDGRVYVGRSHRGDCPCEN